MLTAVVGINWGDEGKGRMVDMLGEKYDIVVRFQGGNNASHTVVNWNGRYVLNLLPSGILREGTVNIMGPGMVIDVEHLFHEVSKLQTRGVDISPDNLKISDRAVICMPYHRIIDELTAKRGGFSESDIPRRGVAPAYADKRLNRSIRMGDLRNLDYIKQTMEEIVDWENIILRGLGHEEVTTGEMLEWLDRYGHLFNDYVCDTSKYLNEAIEKHKSVMFEAQLGALRDVTYGMYPCTSPTSSIAGTATVGAGIPGKKLDNVLGIVKAYSTCVGEGPFACELFDEDAEKLREAGGEYAILTGNPRRVGGFDAVASRYGVMIQGATELALTKLDVLSSFEKIPVCVAYDIDGERVTDFPSGDRLFRAKPIYEYLEGFNCDISQCRSKKDLPKAAIAYIEFIEMELGCKIKYVSVGPEREEYFELK